MIKSRPLNPKPSNIWLNWSGSDWAETNSKHFPIGSSKTNLTCSTLILATTTKSTRSIHTFSKDSRIWSWLTSLEIRVALTPKSGASKSFVRSPNRNLGGISRGASITVPTGLIALLHIWLMKPPKPQKFPKPPLRNQSSQIPLKRKLRGSKN